MIIFLASKPVYKQKRQRIILNYIQYTIVCCVTRAVQKVVKVFEM